MKEFKLQELNTSKGRILFVGDLHLHAKELSSTKKMVQNNIVMLEQIYNYLVQNEDVYLVIFLGDIQHLTPSGKNSNRETYRWDKLLIKIGDLMRERFIKNDIKVIDYQQTKQVEDVEYNINQYGLEVPKILDYNESISNAEVLPLFTLRGNHDIDTERVNGLGSKDDSHLYPFTYYDMCIAKGILLNPKQLIINEEILINFYNYGEATMVMPEYADLDIKVTVGVYHDTLITDDLPLFMQESHAYTIDEAVKNEDIAIVGHIHNKCDVQICETETGHLVAVIIVGSMGRTSTNESQIRDIGHMFELNLEDIEKYKEVSVDLIPANEYFNLREALKKKQVRKEKLNFSLSMPTENESNEVTYQVDAETLINRLSGVDQNVKEKCIELIQKVTNKE